jgi:hypothetical protein
VCTIQQALLLVVDACTLHSCDGMVGDCVGLVSTHGMRKPRTHENAYCRTVALPAADPRHLPSSGPAALPRD